MAETAFTAGVRPGGLTDETQIRVLVCYLVLNFGPVTKTELEAVLWDSQLVNYFELSAAVSALCRLGHIAEREDGYHITATGSMAAGDLLTTVPRSVRDRSMDAMMKMRARRLNASQNRAEITAYGDEFAVRCKIDDMGKTLLDCTLVFPDLDIAEHAKQRFIDNAGDVYQLLIAGLVGDRSLAAAFFEKKTDKPN